MTESTGFEPSAGPEKRCVICGVDCANKPRVKDPQGRYYCRECHERRAHEREEQRAALQVAPTDELSDLAAIAAPSIRVSTERVRRGPSPVDVIVDPIGFGTRASDAKLVAIAGGLVGLLLALAFSFAGVLDTLGMMSSAIPPMMDDSNWRNFLRYPAFAALIGGVLYFLIAPLWFKARVHMAGGTADLSTARGIYFLTAAPAALCATLGVALIMSRYVSPLAFLESKSSSKVLVPIIAQLLLIVGCVFAFLYARGAFQIRAVSGAILIIILPVLWYGMVIMSLAATPGVARSVDRAIANGALDSPNAPSAPNLPTEKFTATADSPYEFSIPTGWVIESKEVESGQYRQVCARAPKNTRVEIWLTKLGTPEMVVRRAIQGFQSDGYRLTPMGDIRELGPYSGSGKQFVALRQDEGAQLQVFATPLEAGVNLLICTWLYDSDGPRQRSNFKIVLDSLVIAEPK